MARAFWSGQLRISLVSFGISLVPATETRSEVHFHQIDRRTGQRVRHQIVTSTDGEPVEKENVVKGYEYDKDEYVQFEPSEIEKLRIASKFAVEVEQFVKVDSIDPAFYERPYFVLPENPATAEAFAVMRKALEDTGQAALGKIALGGRETVIAIKAADDAEGRGMMAYTLRFGDELRDAKEYFATIKEQRVPAEQLSLAKELIRQKSGPFKPEKFHDEYESALRELVEAKLKHAKPPREKIREPRGKVIDLMEALRRSVGDHKKPVKSQTSPAGKGKLRVISSRADGRARRKSA